MRKLLGALALAMCCHVHAQTAAESSPPAADDAVTEVLYVRAQPSIALLSSPAAEAVIIRRLTPGDRLTVVGRQGGYVNVQAADGVQGWLPETDATAVTPPAQRVAELEQQATRLRGELAAAQEALGTAQVQLRRARQSAAAARESGADQSAALETLNASLREELDAANAEVSRLQGRVAELEAAQQMARDAAQLLAARQPAADALESFRFSPTELAAAGAVALALALLGAWLGTASARRRLRRRYHGLEL